MSSSSTDKMEEVIEVEYGGIKITLEPEERATGLIALQMLIQAGLVPDDHSFEISQGASILSSTSGSSSAQRRPSSSSAPTSASLPPSPRSPTSPSFNRDLEVLEHGCSLGSCTHLLAVLNQANLISLSPGGKLKLTANETPDDFRHLTGRGLDYKKKHFEWDNVRVLKGQMQVSF